jgi:hypothetical protein
MRRAAAIAALLAVLPFLAFADESSSSSGSISQLVSNINGGCWGCGTFNTIGAIGLDFADKAFTSLASGLTKLIGLFMALWVLLFAAKLFLPFGSPGSSHWNMGAAKLFKLLFVLAFLQSSGPFWDYIFTPVISTALGLAAQLATVGDSYEGLYGKTESAPQPQGNGTNNTIVDYCTGTPPDTKVALSSTTSQALTALEQMDCPLARIESQYAKGIMIGVAVIGQTGCNKSWLSSLLPSSSTLSYLVAGCILIALFGFGYLVFPFLLLDVLMRVALVAITSPLAIASILFKPTEKIAVRSLWSLAQCGLTLMFGAAIAGIGRAMMAYILSQLPNAPSSLGSWSDLTTALDQSCTSGFHIDFSSAAFYMLCGTAILMIFMMRRATSLAAELTGIAGGVGANAAGAAIAGAVAGAAGRAAQMATNYGVSRAAFNKASQVTGNGGGGDANRAGEVSGNQQK